ncbi:MAG TPA: hypothetical protein VG944_15595 [Fimbriimonas sp.]|nr:hypothetical protein [Fimbriimonas sp.]
MLRKSLLFAVPTMVLAGCGGSEPPQPTMMGGNTDMMMSSGSLGTGPARGSVAAKQPDLGQDAVLNGYKIFNNNDPYSKNVEKLGVDPNSDKILAKIGVDKTLALGFGAVGKDKDKKPFGIPYVVVSGDAPRVAVTFGQPKVSDAGPYPFPLQMQLETATDPHAIVIDRDGQKLYETSATAADGAGFKANVGAVWDLRSYSPRKPGQPSADSSGLPIFPGLLRYEEVNSQASTQPVAPSQPGLPQPLPQQQQLPLDHALRFTLSTVSKGYVTPATASAGTSTDENLPPMGMVLRLKKSYDISKFPASAQVVLKALKKYGMILAEVGPDLTISGTPDPRWNDAEMSTLEKVKASDFEVIRLGAMQGLKDDPKAKEAPKVSSPPTAPTAKS